MHQLDILQLEGLARSEQDERQGLLHADVLGQHQPSALPIVHKVFRAGAVGQQAGFW